MLTGALTEDALTEQAAGQGFAARIAERLNAGGGDSWSGARAEDGTLGFVRQRGERRDRFRLDPQIARSPEGRRLNSAIAGLGDAFAGPATLQRKGQESVLTGPLALIETLTSLGRKGLVGAALQGARRDEPRAAVGDHPRSRGAQRSTRSRSSTPTRPTRSSPP